MGMRERIRDPRLWALSMAQECKQEVLLPATCGGKREMVTSRYGHEIAGGKGLHRGLDTQALASYDNTDRSVSKET
jgi:hypothetical protein